jgi:hypothetical protein
MSATLFGYIMLFTLLIAGAAAAIEWGTQGRIAIRRLWTVAIVFSMIMPPAVLAWHAVARARFGAEWRARTVAGSESMLVTSARAKVGGIVQAVRQDAPPSIRVLLPRRRSVNETMAGLSARFSDVSILLWVVLSLALAAWFTACVLHWRRACRSWTKTTLDGIEVDLSPDTGPAVLGLLSQRIVLPAWATTMQPEHRQLLLAHETEHISARDPQRLALALAALIVMPWNIALWWCVARLRRAIELDCDARVLRRFPSAKEYGYVLLEVARRTRDSSPHAVSMVGLLRVPSELELRLRAMTRPGSASAKTAAAGGILALVAIGAAFTAPAPPVRAGRAIAIGRSAARMISAPARARTQSDTVPRQLMDSLASSRRQVDSMRAMIRSLRAQTATLARVQSDLETTTAALRYAETRYSLPDSEITEIAALQTQLRELALAQTGPEATAARLATLQHARAAISSIRAHVNRAMKAMYPEIVSHADSAAVIWFVADSSGRVLRTMYNSGAPRPALSVDSLSARFPDVNPVAIESVTHFDKVLNRGNLSVTWVQLHGDPSRFFTHSR